MKTPKNYESRTIDNIEISITPPAGAISGDFTLIIRDTEDENIILEITLKGLTTKDAHEFFELIGGMLSLGTDIEEVCTKVRIEANAMEQVALETKKNAATRQGLILDSRDALTNASHFIGKETVNGMEIIVTWYDGLGGGQYEIYLPAMEETLIIGEKIDEAELVFKYAKEEALKVSGIKDLYARVSDFINNGFIKPRPTTGTSNAPRFEPTRHEETVNGIRIVLASNGENELLYYITIPDANMRKLRERMDPGDGRIYIYPPRNPSATFEYAKSLARSEKSPEDMYMTIWNMLR